MADLAHATLAEDEGVLLAALGPVDGRSCLVLGARGNGDAALALLAAGAGHVWVGDHLDRPALDAQLELKRQAIVTWDPGTVRRWLGLEPGMDPGERARLFGEIVRALPERVRGFWDARQALVPAGLAASDRAARWNRRARWARPLFAWLGRWPGLRDGLLRALLSVTGLLAPEQRRHSLGYRQLRAEPAALLARPLPGTGAGRTELEYLSVRGLERIAARLDRLEVVSQDALPAGAERIHLSDLVDFVPADEFDPLLQRVVARAAPGWRVLVNSSYRSSLPHPYLTPAIGRRLVRVDRELTDRLRAVDRPGVYPGLTVLVPP